MFTLTCWQRGSTGSNYGFWTEEGCCKNTRTSRSGQGNGKRLPDHGMGGSRSDHTHSQEPHLRVVLGTSQMEPLHRHDTAQRPHGATGSRHPGWKRTSGPFRPGKRSELGREQRVLNHGNSLGFQLLRRRIPQVQGPQASSSPSLHQGCSGRMIS